MELNEYADKAMSFRPKSAHGYYALFNLAAQAGALHSLYAQSWREGRQDDHEDKAKDIIGEVLWVATALASDYGWTLEEIAEHNVAILTAYAADRKDAFEHDHTEHVNAYLIEDEQRRKDGRHQADVAEKSSEIGS